MITRMTFEERQEIFSSEEKARSYLESILWPNGPVCPHCGASGAYKIEGKAASTTRARKGLLKCSRCRRQFTVTVGTVFQGSHVPLNKWLAALYTMSTSRKGVSANQLHRDLGVTYKTAWFMAHRLRLAMTGFPKTPLAGIVEADETYVGGKTRGGKRGRGAERKTPVFALIARTGEARSFHVQDVKKRTLQGLLKDNVVGTAHIMTDSLSSYAGLDQYFAGHSFVDHGKEYVRGIVHTNFAESFFSLLRRGIIGTFHHVGRQHLHRYLAEFDFRWNRRNDDACGQVEAAIRQASGLRLLYRDSARC